MKANFRNSFAKRSLVIAATALPSLYAGLASAQAAAPPPAAPVPAVPPVPASIAPVNPPTGSVPAPIAGSAAPVAEVPAPAVVTPAAPPMESPDVPPPPPDPMAEKYKHINMGVWMRLDGTLQNHTDPKKLNEIGSTGDVEFHFSNQMRKSLAWTANLVATYGAGSIDGQAASGADGGSPGAASGRVGILDLIAQFEPDEAFNVWVGRMLVPSDRSNFSGPWFMAAWKYPGAFGTGPKEGPFGRNDGVTVWGQANGGLFKYYAGAFNLHDPTLKPLLTGRLNLSLLSPEPGYYSSSTYYGKDILAIGVGGQYQKNGDANLNGMGLSDYGLFNADALFEKNFGASGVLDLEGAFFKYVGDGENKKWSHFLLASYLTPDLGNGTKLQPLLRIQQAIPTGGGDTATQIDAQLGYVVDTYATRLALDFTHDSAGPGTAANALTLGVQLQK
ncbi:MAG: hypothetical protein ABI488_09325 [Polyangiaceae bacterium]